MPNILILDGEEYSDKNSYNKEMEELPKCIQDLKDHPTLADPAFSIFKEFVKLNQASIFDQKFFYVNWKEQENLNDWDYEA